MLHLNNIGLKKRESEKWPQQGSSVHKSVCYDDSLCNFSIMPWVEKEWYTCIHFFYFSYPLLKVVYILKKQKACYLIGKWWLHVYPKWYVLTLEEISTPQNKSAVTDKLSYIPQRHVKVEVKFKVNRNKNILKALWVYT